MFNTQYAVLDDGYNNNTGLYSTLLGPTLGTTTTGYTVGATFNSKAIDLRNVNQFGAICSFLSGSTLAGSLSLQVCDDPPAPSSGTDNQPNASFATWVTITAPTTTVTAISSGAAQVAYDIPLTGHRYVRFAFTYSSGSGVVRFAYTVKGN